MNRYVSAIMAAAMSGVAIQAQTLVPAPKLVVNITIDQFRTDYLEQFAPLYSKGGFKKLLAEGRVYETAQYTFAPVDRSSAIACLATGTTPYYNGIPSDSWLDRETSRTIYSVDDMKFRSSPTRLTVSTVGDEMKVASSGNALVFAVAKERDAAVLSAGHAANGAFWIDEKTQKWTTSPYYPTSSLKWANAYNAAYKPVVKASTNKAVADIAIECISNNALGRDDITDYISITFSANGAAAQSHENEATYVELDRSIESIINHIESTIGADKTLFILTSTGYIIDNGDIPTGFKIPSGTFYINRTGALLNMYLNAIYGKGQYVSNYFHNHIYLNRKFIEDKRLPLSEIISRSKDFLKEISGISGVHESPYKPAVSGDLIVDVTPGWKLINEEKGESYTSRVSFVQFPVIFYGCNVKPEHVSTPITMERIASTIAKSVHIRAPNACAAAPLF